MVGRYREQAVMLVSWGRLFDLHLKITTSASKLDFTAVSNCFFYWSVSFFPWFLHFTGIKSEMIILKHKHHHKVHLEYLKQPVARPTENSWSLHGTLDIRTRRRKQNFGKTVIPSLEILSVNEKVTVFERSQTWQHFLIELWKMSLLTLCCSTRVHSRFYLSS